MISVDFVYLCECTLWIRNSNKCESPAQSPNLNPIEVVWADLKAFVRSKCCRNTFELNNEIAEYKKKTLLAPEKCSSFISHLKKSMNKNSNQTFLNLIIIDKN